MQTPSLKKATILATTFLGVIALIASQVHAGWLFYHKPAFEGLIVDEETGEPLEGAIVMAIYHKRIISIPHGGYAEIRVRETLTDKDGRFNFPSYTTIINPFSVEDYVGFTIYKHGYAHLTRADLEAAFTNRHPEDTEIGAFAGKKIVKVSPGKVALPRLDTSEDAIEDAVNLSIDIPDDTLLKKIIVEELNRK